MIKSSKPCHWWSSPTGRKFYAIKVLGQWRFYGKNTYMIYEDTYIDDLKSYVKNVFGFDYIGYL